MFKNYLKTALTNIKRQKVYSFINIFGLAVGIALFIIISIYIKNEISHDSFHTKIDRIYRVERGPAVVSNPRIAEFIKAEFPEVKTTNRFSSRNFDIQYDNQKFAIRNCVTADSSVFTMFTFPLITGNIEQPFRNKFDIVLTESTAKKIFGNENPVGKIIKVNRRLNYTVTAIAKDLPENSSIKANAFVNFESIPEIYDTPRDEIWDHYNNFSTYALLNKGVDLASFEEKLNKKTIEYLLAEGDYESKEDIPFSLNLRPFSEVYFAKGLRFDHFVEHGKIEFVRIFSVIGIFILLIACVNFINISTARASLRVKEVGIRKVMGSDKKKLIVQYLSEALVITTFATLLALLLVEVMTPVFNSIILANVQINYTPLFVVILILGTLLLGILSGIYPAMVLSSKPILSTIKGEQTSGRKGYSLRRMLTVFQYTISVVLIIATIMVFKQLNYIKTKDTGFDKERIIHVYTDIPQSKKNVLQQKLLKNPDILKTAYGSSVPGWVSMTQGFHTEGESYSFHSFPVDDKFFKLFDIELREGRTFFGNSDKDRNSAYIVNEAAAEIIGKEKIIGKPFRLWERENFGQIVGVVDNFHFRSLHHKIEPLVLYYRPDWSNYLFVKLSGNNMSKSIDYIKSTTMDVIPDYTFNYSFVDESFNRMYKKEQRYGKLFGYFAIIAILIASLGLFGLALFSTNQRFKEISIRKVFGSSSKQVLLLLAGNFSRWVIVANLIGWPIAYYFMDKWLQNFAYRTGISWDVFAVALISSLLIAVATIISQAYRAANSNPAEILRDE